MTHILRPARFGGAARAPESLQDLIDHTWDYDPTHPNAQDFDVLAIMGDAGKRQLFHIDTSTKTVINEGTPGQWGGAYFGTLDGQPEGTVCDTPGAIVQANFHSSQYTRFDSNKAARIAAEVYVKSGTNGMSVVRHRRDGLSLSGLGRWESSRTSADFSNNLSYQTGLQTLSAYWQSGSTTVRGHVNSTYLGYAGGSAWTSGDVSFMRAPFEVAGFWKSITYWLGAQGQMASNKNYYGYDYTKLPLKLRA